MPPTVHMAQRYLTGLAATPEGRGIATTVATPYGQPARGVAEEARRSGATLLAMVIHGCGGLSHLRFGSVAETFLAEAPAPVLLVRAATDTAPAPFGERPLLLVPLDNSVAAQEVLPTAVALACALGGELVLLRAVPDGGDVAEARASLQALAQQANLGPAARVDVRIGAPEDAILASEREFVVGLVVMATYAESGPQARALGNVSGAVLRQGDVPVVLVNPGR